MGLLVGSEGTLAVVTEVTVRLLTRAESIATVLAIFESTRAASETVSAHHRRRHRPRGAGDDGRDERPGGGAGPARRLPSGCRGGAADRAGGGAGGLRRRSPQRPLGGADLCRAHGARSVRTATLPNERDALWRGRKAARGALGRLAPNYYVHDGVVPRSLIPEVMERIAAISETHGLPVATYLHAGDGNLHPNVLFDARAPGRGGARHSRRGGDPARLRRAGGALSGEHGIGLEKQAYLEWVLPADRRRSWR